MTLRLLIDMNLSPSWVEVLLEANLMRRNARWLLRPTRPRLQINHKQQKQLEK